MKTGVLVPEPGDKRKRRKKAGAELCQAQAKPCKLASLAFDPQSKVISNH